MVPFTVSNAKTGTGVDPDGPVNVIGSDAGNCAHTRATPSTSGSGMTCIARRSFVLAAVEGVAASKSAPYRDGVVDDVVQRVIQGELHRPGRQSPDPRRRRRHVPDRAPAGFPSATSGPPMTAGRAACVRRGRVAATTPASTTDGRRDRTSTAPGSTSALPSAALASARPAGQPDRRQWRQADRRHPARRGSRGRPAERRPERHSRRSRVVMPRRGERRPRRHDPPGASGRLGERDHAGQRSGETDEPPRPALQADGVGEPAAEVLRRRDVGVRVDRATVRPARCRACRIGVDHELTDGNCRSRRGTCRRTRGL